MANKYRICGIHAELLEHFVNKEGMIYHINDVELIKRKIRYKTYDEDSQIIAYIKSFGIILMPNDKTNQKNIDIYNTIAIRELINQINGWDLSCFIKDFFYWPIKSSIEFYKHNIQFCIIAQACLHNLSSKEYFLDKSIEAGKDPEIMDYVKEEEYLFECNRSLEMRWQILKLNSKKIGISKKEYSKIDYIFGIEKIFEKLLFNYTEFVYDSWKKYIENIV